MAIPGLPALVTRLFVLPKLRERPFPIARVRELAQVATARQAAELRALLGLPARPDAP